MIRRSERVRRRHASMLRVDMDSTWLFAAALLLPTALATVLMGVIYVRRRIRASGPVPHWRVFTAGTVVLVVHMVSAVLAVTGHAGGQPGGVPRGMAGLVVLLTALGAYLTVGTLLVAGAAALVTGASLTR